MKRASRRVFALAFSLLSFSLPGSPAAELSIAIDGEFPEWSRDYAAKADGEFIFLRFTLGERVTLQGMAQPIRLLVDIDGDSETGLSFPAGSRGFGSDLEVSFSPAPEGGGRGVGVAVRKTPGGGEEGRPLAHADMGLVFAPTTSSKSFELRFTRAIADDETSTRAFDEGEVRLVITGVTAEGRPWQSEVIGVALPPRAAVAEASASLPPRGAGDLRVVSWNVLFARPLTAPDPFARVLRALTPDVVLVQEWEKVDADQLATWFNEYVPASETWQAMVSDGWGVGIVARTPLIRLGPREISRPGEAPGDTFRPDRALRLVSASTDTRLGKIALASVHLRCCGHDGSWQDKARIAEATRMNSVLRGLLARSALPVVIGGDLNLVGSRRPLEILGAGLGREAASLAFAAPSGLDDATNYTWRNPRSAFTPGRLDWLLYDEQRLRVVRSFVLDSRRLSASALASSGIEKSDTDVSDHLPLVVDLRVVR